MNATVTILQPPALGIDKVLYPEGERMGARNRLERRIVWNLIAHLDRAGFKPVATYDGEGIEAATDAKTMMETTFNLDEVSLRFAKPEGNEHGVMIVLGNGEDCISDWNYSQGDGDGFNAAMDAFKVELYL